MAPAQSAQQHAHGEVSPELDALSCDLLADAFDRLAAGERVNVLLVVQDAAGTVTPYEFADDEPDACLDGAHAQVRALRGDAVRYAICYEGSVDADGDGAFYDAVLLEFGEEGWPAYSAFSLYEGRGAGEDFAYTNPAPAGELEPLL